MNSLMELTEYLKDLEDLEVWEMESCNGGVGVGKDLCELLVGSDEFLHRFIFLDGGIGQVVK